MQLRIVRHEAEIRARQGCGLLAQGRLHGDARRSGRVHPAWLWGIAAMLAAFVLTQAITYSPAGTALYDAVTAGYPGDAVDPLAFPPPPDTPLMTGRS